MFTLLNNSHKFTTEFVKQQLENGNSQPNTNITIENVMIKALFGGIIKNNISPFVNINDVVIVCDGTIYNSKKLFEELDIEPETDYDYEIIVHLYIRYGIETTLQLLDGIFAFALLDHRMTISNGELDSTMYVARDPYGVKPLYLLRPNTKNIMIEHNKTYGDIYALSTNIEMLKNFEEEMNTIEHPENNSLIVKGKPKKLFYVIDSILPGTYCVFEQKFRVMASWRFIRHHIPYHMCQIGFNTNNIIDTNQLLQEAIIKRITNKPISVILTENYETFMTAAIANECFEGFTGTKGAVKPRSSLDVVRADDLRSVKSTDDENPTGGSSSIDNEQLNEQEKYVNTFSWSSSLNNEKDIKLVTDYIKTNHTVVTATDTDIENEKENIDPEFTDDSDSTTNFGEFWLMAKTIARIAPNSVVFLEIGMDNLDQLFEPDLIDAKSHIDFQHRLLYYFKSVCSDRLNKISKIFWHHGLEVHIPWLDNTLVQHFITNCKNVEFTFNPIGVYGNKLLPEELFI